MNYVKKFSAGCLPLIVQVDMIPIIFHSLFSLGAVFHIQQLRFGTDLITREEELQGWVSRMASPMLTHIHIYTNWNETSIQWFFE